MARELIFSPTRILIQANTNLVSQMVLGNINGRMEAHILVSLKMVLSMAKASGRRQEIKLTAIVMKGNMCQIRRTGMVYSIGKVEIFIKAVIKKMKEMAMGKCIGLMVRVIKGHGNKESSMDKAK